MPKIETSEHARALSVLGSSKGGKSRTQNMSQPERRDLARKAALARWGDKIPRVTHQGPLRIGDKVIASAVLETRKRVLTQESFLGAIGRARKAKGGKGSTLMVDGLPPFLAAENLKPFISDDLWGATTPIVFRIETGQKAFGYDAMLLPMVCDVYLKARREGKLLKSQAKIAEVCEILQGGLARVGIIALVDEATGYQDDRDRDDLVKILEAYINEALRPWVRTFPPEFFKEIYRLNGWTFNPTSTKRNQQVGIWINKFIYNELPPGVLTELRARNPRVEKGYRRHKFFQYLTVDIGDPHLDRLIAAVTMVMRVSDSKRDFAENFQRAFHPERTVQQQLHFDEPAAEPSV